MRNNQIVVVATMIAATALMSGCRIESDKKNGNDNVKIATPFGGMTVKTNDAAVVDGLGLPVYPGAELVKKDKNNGAADVNMSFGSFQLRVKAASYRTQDSPDQVTAFYRKALGRYGNVIQCQKDKPVGTPTSTAEGLTCDNEKQNHVYVNDDESGKMELKAGSKQHHHSRPAAPARQKPSILDPALQEGRVAQATQPRPAIVSRPRGAGRRAARGSSLRGRCFPRSIRRCAPDPAGS